MGVFTKMRIRLHYSLVLLLGLVVFSAAQAGEIYKWVDKDGTVHYGQQPQDLSAEPMNIKVPKSSAPSEPQNPTTAANQQPAAEGQSEEEAALRQAAEKKQQDAQKHNCQIAMKRLATITAGGRIYEVDEQGERVYWDDNTRQSKLAEAQKDVDKWCSQE